MSANWSGPLTTPGATTRRLAGVAGSGSGGRVTIQDFEQFLSVLEKQRLTQASTMRVAVADAMRRRWARPIATVDMPVQLDTLPEQTLVLGLGAGRKAPFWDEAKQAFVPVTETNLTLSFDHRVLDGGGAGRLLSRLAQLLEDPTRL